MGTLQKIVQAVADDFADLPDSAQFTRVTVRLVMAVLLGGLIGYERELRRKAAGFRTHILVALGAALLVLVIQQYGGSSTDIVRVIQGLVTGIGFLGAGTILMGRQEKEIQGLTTAASIWLTAAIGVAAGLGRESTAVLATVLALLVLAVLPRFERWALPAAPPELPSPPPDVNAQK